MTRAMRAVTPGGEGPRCLRLAVVREGRIVSERLCRSRDVITIGDHEASTLPVPGVAGRRALFDRRRDGYVLVLGPGMRARIGSGGESRELEGPAEVPVRPDARGRVTVGETTLLFQSVPVPPRPARPALPSAVRGGFLASIDWLFSATTLGSFVVFCTVMIVLEGMDFPVAETAQIPDAVVQMIMEEPPPPDDPVELADAADPTDATSPDVPSTDRDRAEDARPARHRPPRDSGEATLADADALRTAVALQIGTLLGDGAGDALDRLIEGGPTTDAASLLADVDGVEVASTDAAAIRARNGCRGASCTSTDGDLSRLARHRGPLTTADEGRPLEEQVITIRVPGDMIDEPTGRGFFDAARVTAEVRRRLASIRRCYEHTLGAHGDVSGKVTVDFTIQEIGSVTNVRTVENTTGTPLMATCVERSIRTLRFDPGPEGGAVTFRYPFVFAEQR